MTQIILKTLENGVIIFIDYPGDLNKNLKNPDGTLTGKTLRQHIQEDIASNTDKTGWVKYKKILKDINEISQIQHDVWTVKSSLRSNP